MKWFLKKKIRHLRRKLVDEGLTEREARAYLDGTFRLRGNRGHLDFDDPKTYNDKLNWLKLYWYDPLVCTCADKIGVREHVSRTVGDSFLVPLIGTYDRVEDVDFGALPDRFAMKVNWGSGQNIICPEKSKLDIGDAKRKIIYWMRPEANHYFDGLEWCYRDIKPKILVEEYLENAGDLPDYKFYCFNGKPRVILIVRGRMTDSTTMDYFDERYSRLQFLMAGLGWNPSPVPPPKPALWDRMLEVAERLSAPFPHVRVDFYIPADGVLKIGELTFWTGNGMIPFDPPEWDRRLGDMLKLPPKGEYRWGRSK